MDGRGPGICRRGSGYTRLLMDAKAVVVPEQLSAVAFDRFLVTHFVLLLVLVGGKDFGTIGAREFVVRNLHEC